MVHKNSVVKDVLVRRIPPISVAQRWPLIRKHLIEGLVDYPVQSKAAGANLLAALQSGQIQAWAVLTKQEKKPVLVGMLFTIIVSDGILGGKKLSIYAARGYIALHSDVYKSVLEVLSEFGKENGCGTIQAVTSNARVRRMLERAGWTSRTIHDKEL